ncbi:MAG: ABC transporter substrate-binding protein [Planctomycetota bacterium]
MSSKVFFRILVAVVVGYFAYQLHVIESEVSAIRRSIRVQGKQRPSVDIVRPDTPLPAQTAVLNMDGAWRKAATTLEAQKLYIHKEPDWDAGADPAVKAEDGGRGFKGEGWQTAADYNFIGDPRALKGGKITLPWHDFPATFRNEGKESNLSQLSDVAGLMYENLLGRDPINLEYTPSLATHWKISADGKTFTFRLNPSARWADGMPVTGRDVEASLKLVQDPGIESPSSNTYYEGFTCKALSKYIVEFQSPDSFWRSFQKVAFINIYPHHVLKDVTGAQYLKKFQNKFMTGTGPYVLKEFVENSHLTLKRRTDYWGEGLRGNIGCNNFDEITFRVIPDDNVQFEALKKGDIDYYAFSRAQMWAQQTDDGRFKSGHILKRRIFNRDPVGTSGLGFNMRTWPFNDINVRLAVCHLVDFDTMNEKYFFGQYYPMTSYYQGLEYENPGQERRLFSLDKARDYLEKAGWTQKNSEGILVKDGKPFQIELINTGNPAMERLDVMLQENMRKVGISLNIVKKSGIDAWKVQNERQFQIIRYAWTESLWPYPRSSYHSETADQNNTTNLYGVKDARIDKLCDDYEKEPDLKKRIPMLREIDRILCNEIVPSALGWYGPYVRVAFQNYIEAPDYYIGPYSSHGLGSVMAMWWYNPEKKARYDESLKKGEDNPRGTTDQKYWVEKPSGG